MKKFILRAFLFIVLTTIVMVILDLCLTHKLKQRPFYPYDTWNDIYNGCINADLLIMGSSRAWVHISPEILDSVLHTHSHNIGQDGSGFNRQYFRYKEYRKYNSKPEVILQNIDLNNFTYTRGYDQYQFFPYFYNADVRREVLPNERFTLADKILPFYRYANFGVKKLSL